MRYLNHINVPVPQHYYRNLYALADIGINLAIAQAENIYTYT